MAHKLVVGEKPSVGKAISAVVGADKSSKTHNEGNGYIVSWAFGHLFSLADIEHYCVASGRENELTDLIGKMRKEGRLPVKDKKGGREALDEIYACLR